MSKNSGVQGFGSTIECTIAIATEAHARRVDKAGEPSILHPLRVMLRMKTNDERIGAVLRDVVEDSDWTLKALRAEGFSQDVLRAIDSVTRRENETYEEFVLRAGLDPIGRRVKVADLEDNCNLRRIAVPTEKDHARIQRDRRAIEQLRGPARGPAP